MYIIIYVPKNSRISEKEKRKKEKYQYFKEEIKSTWNME